MPSSRNSEEHEGVWVIETKLHLAGGCGSQHTCGDLMLAAHPYNTDCVTDRCHAFAKMKIHTKICVLYVHNINHYNNLF